MEAFSFWTPGWLSAERPTLDFSSGHELPVHTFESRIGLHTDGAEPSWDSLSSPLSAPPTHALSLKINKLKKKKPVYLLKPHNCRLLNASHSTQTLSEQPYEVGVTIVTPS